MITEFALVPSRRTIRRLDVVSAILVLGFAALGLVAGLELWSLAQLHRALLDAGTALEATGRAIELVAVVPFIGDDAQRLSGEVIRTAAQVRVDALQARHDARVLAVVVGAAIALVALVPVAVLYLPLRWARRRELRGLRRLLAGSVEPMLVEHLARAAVRRVPYGELRRVSRNPWRDLERGEHIYLAAVELRRLGLAPPRGWSPQLEPGRTGV